MLRPLTRHLLFSAFAVGLCGCGEDKPETGGPTDTGEPAADTFQFSLAVLADPHVTASGENEQRLAAAVAWLNDHAEERGIELVVIVGDIAWSGGWDTGKAVLDELTMAWVPVIGDNEIHSSGGEEQFGLTWGPQLEVLAAEMDDWQQAPVPVSNPDYDQDSWFYNYTFGYRGLHLLCMDWASRSDGQISGEMADLHDFEGGTFPWFQQVLPGLDLTTRESVLFFSHHPMFMTPGAFDDMEDAAVEGFIAPYSDYVYASFAGHFHVDYEESLPVGGYDIYMTDATWDDDIEIRLVEVWGNGNRFSYTQELVVVEPD